MVTDPFNSQPLEVKVVKGVGGEIQVTPKEPVYKPSELLDYIKGNGGCVTVFELERLFAGSELLALVAFTDLDASGLIEPTEEFQEGSKGKFHRVYRLTEVGQKVDYASLRPRTNVTSISLPKTFGVLNRALETCGELETGGDLETALASVLESLGPEERHAVEREFQRLRFPTYNSQ